MSQVKCQACGTNLAADASACRECGSWRPPQYSTPQYSTPQYSPPLPVQPEVSPPSPIRHEVIQPEVSPPPPAQPEVSPPKVSPPSTARRAVPPAAAWSPDRRRSWPHLRSRRAKTLAGLPLGIAAAALIAIFQMAAPARAPGSRVSPPASSARASTQAPATPATTPPVRLSRADRWLTGLDSLQTTMTNAMGTGSGSVAITPELLRSQASQLGRCTRELARLGHPSAQLVPVYQEARQACIDYTKGAKCYAAAASAYTESGPGVGKFSKLLDCGDAGANLGSSLLANAVADGSMLRSP